MAQTYKMIREVTITTTSGSSETLTGGQANTFWSQLQTGKTLISVQSSDEAVKVYNLACICTIHTQTVPGEGYTAQELEYLFCKPKKTEI